jgi:hypothetical protein
LLKIRVDVDYPYSSRLQSFISVALKIRPSKNYLKNPKIVARMINESPREVRAYWFFTPRTIPDKELLRLLKSGRHEIGLHIATDPVKELKLLKEATGRKIRYYTIHGTDRFLARLLWRRWKTGAPKVPDGYPLESFYQFPTMGLDVLCYSASPEQAVRITLKEAAKGYLPHIHPIWLFQRGRLNRRGPYYEALRRILDVDKELETLVFRKRLFFRIVSDAKEYEKDVNPDEKFIQKLSERQVDIFNFVERRWCNTIQKAPKNWVKESDNVAFLDLRSYDEWWKSIGKKTRNMIRKAEKSGIRTEIAEPNEKLAEGMWKIYNETPIRQERAFPHYGISLKTVRENVLSSENCTFIAAYFQDELSGFIQLVHGNRVALISQILSLQKHWDKAVSNGLLNETIKFCTDNHIQWIVYGRMGNHPSLDNFKQNNGFTRFELTRFYIPLTRRGRVAIALRLHREAKDVLPQSVKHRLIPAYNWISRTKMLLKVRLRPRIAAS